MAALLRNADRATILSSSLFPSESNLQDETLSGLVVLADP